VAYDFNFTFFERPYTMRKLLLVLLLFPVLTFAQANRPAWSKTVEEYYTRFNEMADDPFKCDDSPASAAARIRAIVVKDVKNGYIRAKTTMGILEVAVFKDAAAQTEYVLYQLDGGPHNMCTTDLRVMVYKNGKWTEKPDLLPQNKISEANAKQPIRANMDSYLAYKLPQKGTTVTATWKSSGKRVFALRWEKGKFVFVP